jgi:hypothetical protein
MPKAAPASAPTAPAMPMGESMSGNKPMGGAEASDEATSEDLK